MNHKAKLDRIFSEYVRRRDSDKHTGYGRCISCGRIIHWRDSDAGHYVNRQHMSLRYDERNVHLQCRKCNRFMESNAVGYTQSIIKKYGIKILDYLHIKQRSVCKFSEYEYKDMIKRYTAKVKLLRDEMGDN